MAEPKSFLAYMRRRLDLTQEALAELAGLPKHAIHKIENNEWVPNEEQNERIFAALVPRAGGRAIEILVRQNWPRSQSTQVGPDKDEGGRSAS